MSALIRSLVCDASPNVKHFTATGHGSIAETSDRKLPAWDYVACIQIYTYYHYIIVTTIGPFTVLLQWSLLFS